MEKRGAIFARLKAAASMLLIAALSVVLSGCAGFGLPGTSDFTTVVIDPGHGGHDSGAHACSGVPEKMLTLDVGLRLADILKHDGFHVVLTRNNDYFVTLGYRVAVASASGNCIFVSIHFNMSPSSEAHGIETYYYNLPYRHMAANIQKEMLKAYGGYSRGVKQNTYYVLHHNRRPAVLCELAFISNPHDNSYAQNPEYRQRLAEAIARGIIAERQGRNP